MQTELSNNYAPVIYETSNNALLHVLHILYFILHFILQAAIYDAWIVKCDVYVMNC